MYQEKIKFLESKFGIKCIDNPENPFVEIPLSQLKDEQSWLNIRKEFIGSSDVGVIMGQNDYKSLLQLWQEKTYQPADMKRTESEYEQFIINTESGKAAEPRIVEDFEFWEPVFDGEQTEIFNQLKSQVKMWENRKANRKLREIEKPDVMMFSKRYPFLSSNLDGRYEKGGKKYLVEIKERNHWSLDKFVDQLPHSDLLQVVEQLVVTGYQLGFLVIKVDHQRLVFAISPTPEIVQEVCNMATAFWKKVIIDRDNLSKQMAVSPPSADSSPALEKYLKRTTPDDLLGFLEGDEEDLKMANQRMKMSTTIKELEKDQRLAENHIKQRMLFSKANVMNFKNEGQISLNQSKSGVWSFNFRKFNYSE